ncbi:MAG: hypothetical protein HFG29_10220 [Eubacterium sp.]|nr:hypothetical protein [Eubacterium sp.]
MKTKKELKPGLTFDADGVEMLLLDVSEDGQVLCITKDLYAERVVFGDSTEYEGSNVEKKVKEFEQHMIKCFGAENVLENTVEILTVDGKKAGTYTGKSRLLTFDEARKYTDLIEDENLPDWWWLMSPWSIPRRRKWGVACVCPSGFIDSNDYDYVNGVRPVCILSSFIFNS